MNYIKYVNIKQGTKSVKRFSNGNTLPLVQVPFGFASFSVQTDFVNGGWFYSPESKYFEGIRITRQPSPWIGDHGAVVFTPQTEKAYGTFEEVWSGYTEEAASPHYLKLYSKRAKCTTELTPTMYGAKVRLSFENDDNNFLSILPVGGDFEFHADGNKLYCSTNQTDLKGYDSDCFNAYYVFEFENNSIDTDNIGDSFVKLKEKTVEFYIASSYISYEQAELNIERGEFDEIKSRNEKDWNEHLGRIRITAAEDVMKTFYSCMYRVFLYPHRAYEVDADGSNIYYAPCDGTVKKGVRYTDNGFWDTYRTIYPLFSLIAKTEYKEIAEGFINDYKDGGWLPCWTALDAKKCMPSTMIDAVIADAAVNKIISGSLLETAYEGMKKHANIKSENPAYGREGCEYYTELGYVPYDKCHESVNLTLDAAYGDWCIATVADILGHGEDKKEYLKRSLNYANIFDKETGFMRPKNTSGEFRPNFSPVRWGEDYTEAAAWQTTFAVQHDFDGLAKLFGGKEKLLAKLDKLFASPTEYTVGGYEKEIHEMTEFAVGNWGQCAISNQPSFHIPFIYAYFGENEKTEYWVRKMCEEAFSSEIDGFPGDEDNGTMAAWYIFSVIGIYPLCPGKKEFIKIKPIANTVEIPEK